MKIFDKDNIKEEVIKKLKEIPDLELPISIYDLGLIYKIEAIEKESGISIDIDMTLIDSRCSSTKSFTDEIAEKIKTIDEIFECNIHFVFTPKWDVKKITPEGLEQLKYAGANSSHSMF